MSRRGFEPFVLPARAHPSANGSPVVTVITTTYNRAHTIERAIASVRAQTLSNWRHIIIDDGSVDDTAHRVCPYVKADPRLQYVRQPNRGLLRALNRAACLASTPFLAFLDCDDEYTPDHLALRLSLFKNDPELALVAGGLRAVGPRSRQYLKDAVPGGRLLHASQCPGLGGTFVLRRAVFHAIGGFFEKMLLWDYDAWQRIKHSGRKVAYLRRKTLIYHCEGDDRISWKARQNDVLLTQVTT